MMDDNDGGDDDDEEEEEEMEEEEDWKPTTTSSVVCAVPGSAQAPASEKWRGRLGVAAVACGMTWVPKMGVLYKWIFHDIQLLGYLHL